MRFVSAASRASRAVSVPSLRYIVHLNAPGLSVIGAGEPALPGISIGHNGQIAFGLTIFAIDQEDLYVYQTNPENPREYRYQSGFEPMTVVREAIEVKGETPRSAELLFMLVPVARERKPLLVRPRQIGAL
jgi:penicillin amidase